MATTQTAETPTAPRGAARPRRSSRAKQVEEAARSYFAAIADRDPGSAAAHWHPEGVEDLVPLGVLRGPAEVRGFFEETFAAVPDSEFRVTRVVADHETAAVEWRMTGTFEGRPFQGIEPTGRRVDLRGTDLLEIDEEGRITRNTAYYDGAAFARDIGMLPPQDGTADRAMRAAFNAVTRLRRRAGALR